MPANVDTMMSVREVPWHREGQVLGDYPGSWDEARKQAGLDWDPVTAPVFVAAGIPELGLPPEISEHYEKVGGWQAITRSDTGAVLSVAKTSYVVIDHGEMGEIVEAVLAQPNVKWETAGSLDGGRAVWCLAKLDEPLELPGDDSPTMPYLGITNRHDGTAACALRATAVRIVCHAEGTVIDDHGWRGKVQDHPSAYRPRLEKGVVIGIKGLPFTETVTSEHLYWARTRLTVAERRNGHPGVPAAWTEARKLQPGVHEIGYPLPDGTSVEWPPPVPVMKRSGTGRNIRWYASVEHDPRLVNHEMWWAIGYWWGNGNIHYGRNRAIAGLTWSVPDKYPEILSRLVTLLRSLGWTGNPTQRQGCSQVTWTDRTLAGVLADWRQGQRRKCPPAWVENLPLAFLKPLVRGYYDADGNKKTRDGAIITSVGFDGLLALRRILLRLGIPSSIRRASRGRDDAQIQGRTVRTQDSYSIRFWENTEQLGIVHRFAGRYSIPYIQDGVLWSQVRSAEESGHEKFWPITTDTADYITAFGRSHNCANTFRAAELEGERTGTTFSFIHRPGWRDRITEARQAVTGARREIRAYAGLATELLGIPVSDRQRALFIREFIPMPPDGLVTDRVARNVTEARQALEMIFASRTTEQIAGTVYGLVQGAGEYLDHVRRARTWETRLGRTLMRPEPLKHRALALARQVADADI